MQAESAEYRARVGERRARILEEVAAAAAQSGRDACAVTLCAVSKTVDVEQVVDAYAVGYREFAENRPQELERKLTLLGGLDACRDARWHMIGNLQANKVGHVLACRPALVHSVASLGLARTVARRALAAGMVQPVLLEVNVSGEQSKSGFAPSELREGIGELAGLEGIRLRGLMTMAPQGDAGVAERVFESLRELRDELAPQCRDAAAFTELSMGMSEDYREAVRQGATIIRLGRVVFDPGFSMG